MVDVGVVVSYRSVDVTLEMSASFIVLICLRSHIAGRFRAHSTYIDTSSVSLIFCLLQKSHVFFVLSMRDELEVKHAVVFAPFLSSRQHVCHKRSDSLVFVFEARQTHSTSSYRHDSSRPNRCFNSYLEREVHRSYECSSTSKDKATKAIHKTRRFYSH